MISFDVHNEEQANNEPMDCPKCGAKNGIYRSWNHLLPINTCWRCGLAHEPGGSHESLELQLTGKVDIAYREREEIVEEEAA